MKLHRQCLVRLALTIGCWVVVGVCQTLLAAPGDGPDVKQKRPPGDDDGRFHKGPERDEDPFRNLSSEQREQLREAVRRAWSDPAVIEARDKLKSAAEAYQDALNSSIKRSSPQLSDAIDSLRRDSESAFKMYGGHGPSKGGDPGGSGGRRGDWRDYEGFLTMENPPFLHDLDPEKQKIYRDAHSMAMKSDDVKQRIDSLRELRKSDEEMRRERIEQIRRVHQAVRKAMAEADPRVLEFLPENRRPGDDGNPPPPKPPGPGEGPPVPPTQ